MVDDQTTLAEILLSEGFTYRPSEIEGKQCLFDKDGKMFGPFDAFQAWTFIKQIAGDRGRQWVRDYDAKRESRPT